MNKENHYIDEMNKSIRNLFKSALGITFTEPAKAFFLIKVLQWQRKAAKIRKEWENKGVHVPPFMIASVTKRCNLRCKGCYAMAQNRTSETEMSTEKLKEVFNEAEELGISIALIAGGEPFIRKEILDITKDFPQMIFPVFTNGMLIDDGMANKIQDQKNVIPVISTEGYDKDTDYRRGEGVSRHLKKVFAQLSKKKIFWGVSVTVTGSNFEVITSDEFINDFVSSGCRLFFFVEYIPVSEGTEELVISEEQRDKLQDILNDFRQKCPSLFIAFPGDEEKFGGCLSSGRGFIHISPGGSVEPCPFAPYSYSSLGDLSLKEALQSEFLLEIRNNYRELSESHGGCALWEKRDWVASLLASKKDA